VLAIALSALPFFLSAASTSTRSELPSLRVVSTFKNERAGATYGTLSPDGRLAVLSVGTYLHVHNANTGKLVLTLTGHTSEIRGLAFDKDGTKLASGSADRTVRIWDTRTGKLLQTLRGHNEPVYWVDFANDGQTLASGTDATAIIWDLKRGRSLRTLSYSKGGYAGRFSPNGKWLVTATSGFLTLWDVVTGARFKSFKNGGEPHYMGEAGMVPPMDGLAFSPNSRLLAYNDDRGQLVIYDTITAKTVRSIKSTEWDVTFSASGKEVYAGSTIYDVATGKKSKAVDLADILSPIHFNDARSRVLTFSASGVPKVWTWPGGKLISRLTNFSPDVFNVGFDRSGRLLYTAGAGYRYGNLGVLASGAVWNTETGKAVFMTPDFAEVASLSPDGRFFAYASLGNKSSVQVVELKKNAVTKTFKYDGRVSTITFSSEGTRLAVGSYTSINVYDTTSWQTTFETDNDNSAGLQFSPDARTLYVNNAFTGIQQWNLSTRKRERLLGAPDRTSYEIITSLAISPDGKWLAVNSTHRKKNTLRVRVYNASSAKLAFEHTAATSNGGGSVAFSPDNHLLAVGNISTVELLRLPGGAPVKTLGGFAGRLVNSVAFSPDGRFLAVSSGTLDVKASVTVWGTGNGDPVFAPAIANLRKLEDAYHAGSISPTQYLRAKTLLERRETDPVLQDFLDGRIDVKDFARQF